MKLTAAATDEFESGDRRRGDTVEMIEKVQLVDVGKLGVRAAVEGSMGETYEVLLDFSELVDSSLGVSCDCPRFCDGYNCKHLWATITKFDLLYASPFVDIDTLDLFEVDDVLIGDSLTSRIANRVSGPARGAKKAASGSKPQAPRKPQPPAWKSQLSGIASSLAASPRPSPLGLPTGHQPDSIQQAQHWFVFSISDPANSGALRVASMQSYRKADGDWSRPTSVELLDSDIADLSDPQERHALAMLEPVRETNGYRFYGNYRQGHRLFSVEPLLVRESLEALHATGRLAWKLGDSKQHFEDARRVDDVSVAALTTMQLRVAPDPDQRTKLIVTPELVVPDIGVCSIEQLMWSSTIGCALLQFDSEPTDLPDNEESPETLRTRLVTIAPNDCRRMRAWQKTPSIQVPRTSLKSLLVELSTHHGDVDLELHESLKIPKRVDEPVAHCLLEQREPKATDFTVSMSIQYPNRDLTFDSTARWWFDDDAGAVQLRNWDAERNWLSKLDHDVLDFSIDRHSSNVSLAPDRFLTVVESLRESGWSVTANGAPLRIASDIDIQVTSGVDWFDLDAEVAFDDVNASLPKLLEALQSGASTIQLDDGTVGMLPQDWLSKFVGIRESGQEHDGSIRFHRSQGLLLDLLLEEQGGVKRDHDFSKFLRQVKSFDGIKPAAPPKTFAGELRDYQRTGLGWLRFLQKFGFGGCLADDMGLGKTIQVLALLEARRKRRVPKGQTRNPSIVVVPKSLVFNWLDEASRFTPKLRVRNHTGTERKSDWDAFTEAPDSIDVLLTTYGTMRIDAPLLAQMQFDYAILDEAQAIKNPKSLVARASRLLPAEHRLAMTGTPIENHLGDLWSLFDFLNPGMLANAKPSSGQLPDLEDEAQRRHVERLGKSLQPFILRRTKSEVLTELPEKVEQTLSCSIDKKQRKLYDELREHYRVHLSNKVKELGLKKAKIHVLEALLRLRQAACDPRLIHPDCGVRGAKIEELLERLDELHREGRKALVFSQFTSLLGLLKQDLDQRGWNYEYLDGKTRKRAEKVRRFQNDPECQLFLISLKAGGNGLNLTAAEYVFILDPWWNPAVEAQAIDRAHRMGQTQSVNAYRMICSGTVEEKIVELQKSKRNLADAIVSQNKSLIGQLTAQDLQDLLG
ncbi:ATP-dependent helicase HepA [Stieleria neptunia]|uniref:ATP-dependent helicase HepA n=1 Tax=Stieleria neptunia TaxID=2527979 RepID=A0A518HVM2_9BACT|nr:DEAD/DEAH box helicase [Stieleria neptunia]QDV44905.1 ATP-dependent helicase HepA [Stieleria neptunia]